MGPGDEDDISWYHEPELSSTQEIPIFNNDDAADEVFQRLEQEENHQ